MIGILKMGSMGATRAHSSVYRTCNIVLLAVMALLLAGCAGGGGPMRGFFAGGSGEMQPIALGNIAAPSKIAGSLKSELRSAAQQRKISVVSGASATYTLRGYLATSPEGAGHKVAYIWDIMDKSNKRVHRILGEQLVPKKGADPWAGVSKSALSAIAGKTMTDLAGWLRKQAPAARPVATATQRSGATASTGRSGSYLALVPSVKGAPGDGRKSLTRAIKNQLASKGVKLASAKGNNVYTVAGKVKMGRPTGNKQTISIEWRVSDPKGKNLGKVSQNNTIQKGSLDRSWGKAADAAAAAAADGIIKLLPRSRR